MKLKHGTVIKARHKSEVTLAPMPDYMMRKLDAMGVRSPEKPLPVEDRREYPSDAGWSLRGEECPH